MLKTHRTTLLSAAALLVVTALPMAAQGAAPGPFGFHEGMTLAELQSLGAKPTKTPGIYSVGTAPQGSSDIDFYQLVVEPSTGLCKLVAVGKDVETSGSGSELRSAYESIQAALTTKYGEPAVAYDFLRAGSLWTEPQYFMMGLLKLDRSLTTYWGTTDKPLPANAAHIHTVALDTKATGSSTGYVTIGYEFNNFETCHAKLTSARNSVF